MWSQIPEPLLLQIFMNLTIKDMSNVCRVCYKWNRIGRDNFLWKKLFYRRFSCIDVSIGCSKGSDSYREEAKRLIFHTPIIECETLSEHKEQVLHVCFAHNGMMFSSCSRDGTVKLWSTKSFPTKVIYSANMRSFSWNYAQFSQFNESDTLLLVSGVHIGVHTVSGEIAVFNTSNFNVQSRVLNIPYDLFGAWYTDDYLISGRLHLLDHLESCSDLWLNKAKLDNDCFRKPIIKRMFKFYNKNASSIRTVLVAKCVSETTEEKNAESKTENNCICRKTNKTKDQSHNDVITEASTSDVMKKINTVCDKFENTNSIFNIQMPPSFDQEFNIFEANLKDVCTKDCKENKNKQSNYRSEEYTLTESSSDINAKRKIFNETENNSYMVNERNNSNENLCQNGKEKPVENLLYTSSHGETSKESFEEETNKSSYDVDKFLLFTAGSLTYTPHQIGIKRISQFQFHEIITETDSSKSKQDQEMLSGAAWHNMHYDNIVSHQFDDMDHVIDLKGHIIGMKLSPDHRFLFVNCRSWPENTIIEHPLYPPPIGEQIDIYEIDLLTFKHEKKSFCGHKAYTPYDECFFIFLDVSEQLVASGAEDNCGYVWDRHYGICLGKLDHNDIVNSVAFNPRDQEMLVTSSDDFTLKIWRSKAKSLSMACG